MTRKNSIKLNTEERDILKSFEKGEWQSTKNAVKEKKLAKRAAENYLKKEASVSIKLSNSDLEYLKQRAAFEGVSYKAFIANILHNYVSQH